MDEVEMIESPTNPKVGWQKEITGQESEQGSILVLPPSNSESGARSSHLPELIFFNCQ